jgi:hypothetical protein
MNTDSVFANVGQQGAQMQAEDTAKANQYQGQYGADVASYNTANQAAQTAQEQYQSYNASMVDPQDLYNQAMTKAQGIVGYDPGALGVATQNLIRTQNAMNASQQASQSATGGYGLSGAQLGNYYASQQAPIAAQLQNQNTAVTGLTNLYQQTLTQAQQQAGLGFQGEQLKSQNYYQAVQTATGLATQAQQQAAQSLSMMQLYSQLASTQGGLNSTNAANYAAAKKAYADAQSAYAMAGMLAQEAESYKQTAAGQGLQNQAMQNQLDAAKNGGGSISNGSLLQGGSSGGLQLAGNTQNAAGNTNQSRGTLSL